MKYLVYTSIFLFLSLGLIAQEEGYKIGDAATDFSLKNTANNVKGIDQKVSLSDYKNVKGFIVIFTCNHCPYSKDYEDRIINIHRTYALRGYPVVAINPNDEERVPEDSYSNMKVRAREKGFPFAYLHDSTQEIAKAYGATKTPHVYLVQKKNEQNIVRYIGAIDDNRDEDSVGENYLCNAIDDLLKGELPSKSSAKAFGCTIKWKQ